MPAADLASANALRNTIDNVTVIAGPALGALLLLVGPPQNAVWINAGAFLLSAVLISRVRTRTEAVDVTEGGELGAARADDHRHHARSCPSPATAVMVAYSVLATLVFGVDTVLFVAASDQILGTGPDGYGYLLAGLGIGGVLAAPLVTRAEARPALGPIILAGMARLLPADPGPARLRRARRGLRGPGRARRRHALRRRPRRHRAAAHAAGRRAGPRLRRLQHPDDLRRS